MGKSQINTEELHPIETKILDAIDIFTEISLTSLIEKTNLTIDQIRRGLQWLKFKNIIEYSKPSTLLTLDILGKSSIEHGLPERRLVNAVKEGNTTITKILENGTLMQSEINIAISKARSNKWIELINTENTVILPLLDSTQPQVKRKTTNQHLIHKFRGTKELRKPQLHGEPQRQCTPQPPRLPPTRTHSGAS